MTDQLPAPEGDPYTTTDSRRVYANPWITVTEHDVVLPDGSAGLYGVVHKALALGVVAVDDDDRVVLVGQWRYPLGRYSWELVEGAHEPDEDDTPLGGIQRELAEEAGLAAATWELLTPRPVALSNSVTDEEALLWLATSLSPAVAEPDPAEQLQVARLPFDEAVARAVDGRIDDAMSVLGLLLADRRRRDV